MINITHQKYPNTISLNEEVRINVRVGSFLCGYMKVEKPTRLYLSWPEPESRTHQSSFLPPSGSGIKHFKWYLKDIEMIWNACVCLGIVSLCQNTNNLEEMWFDAKNMCISEEILLKLTPWLPLSGMSRLHWPNPWSFPLPKNNSAIDGCLAGVKSETNYISLSPYL